MEGGSCGQELAAWPQPLVVPRPCCLSARPLLNMNGGIHTCMDLHTRVFACTHVHMHVLSHILLTQACVLPQMHASTYVYTVTLFKKWPSDRQGPARGSLHVHPGKGQV